MIEQTKQPNPQTPLQPQLTKPQPSRFRQSSRFAELLSTLIAIVAALGLAVLLITFVFQSYQVDGPSMETTLQNNDRLIVWKFPRTWGAITGHPYVPERGDVVIFNETNLSSFGQADVKQLVKRVIGLPGDRVVIKNGHITVYTAQHPQGYDPDKTLPYGKDNPLPMTSGDIDVTLDKDQIYVCGDNRPNSLDSRAFGPVSLDDVVGKLTLRIYPLGSVRTF